MSHCHSLRSGVTPILATAAAANSVDAEIENLK